LALLAEGKQEKPPSCWRKQKPPKNQGQGCGTIWEKQQIPKASHELIENQHKPGSGTCAGAYLAWEGATAKPQTKLLNAAATFPADSIWIPPFLPGQPIAEHLGLPADGAKPAPKKKDTGKRASLDSLGHFVGSRTTPQLDIIRNTNRQGSLTIIKDIPCWCVLSRNGCAIAWSNELAGTSRDDFKNWEYNQGREFGPFSGVTNPGKAGEWIPVHNCF